jgi:hypothetical protein
MQDSGASPAGWDRPSGPANGAHRRISESDHSELPNIVILARLEKDP